MLRLALWRYRLFREEKRRPFHYVLFVVLLFNPAMTSAQVLMRVYRNGFSAVTAFMVVICAIAVYRRRREVKRSWIPWVLAESIALPAFWYTREDSIWLLPFVAGSALVAVVSILVGGGKAASPSSMDAVCNADSAGGFAMYYHGHPLAA